MTSFSESDDDLNSGEDLDMDVSIEQEEAQDANIQEDVMQDADAQDIPASGSTKAPIRFRRGLRSQITLGEEIT